MTLISWGPSLELGIALIDEQHQRLIFLLNRLNDAMLAGHSKEVVHDVLEQLIDYTQYHFSTEEQLMKLNHYQAEDSHCLEHQRFIDDVQAFQRQCTAGQERISIDIMMFLRDWLARHILHTDKKLADTLQASGTFILPTMQQEAQQEIIPC